MKVPKTYIVRYPLGSLIDGLWQKINTTHEPVPYTDISWPVDNAVEPVFGPLRQVINSL